MYKDKRTDPLSPTNLSWRSRIRREDITVSFGKHRGSTCSPGVAVQSQMRETDSQRV